MATLLDKVDRNPLTLMHDTRRYSLGKRDVGFTWKTGNFAHGRCYLIDPKNPRFDNSITIRAADTWG